MIKLNNQLEKLGTETAFSVSAEAKAWKDKGYKVYPFHLGDLNFQTPLSIREKTTFFMNKNKNGYCPSEGIPELRKALAKDVGEKRNVEYGLDNVIIQPGGKPTIWKFLATVMNAGDEVLYPNPGYPIYESQINYQGGVALPYRYNQTENGFGIDLDYIAKSISANTKILILNNYQNPMSASSSKEELKALSKLVIKHDLWVLSDDAYYEIRYSQDSPNSILNFPGMKQRTVVLYTFSKKYAMTGWRIGASIGPESLIKHMARFNINDESCTNHFIQHALASVLNDSNDYGEEIIKKLIKRRDLCLKKLNSIADLDISTPESTFYLFPNVSKIMGKKGYDNLEKFRIDVLKNTGVSFCTREHFGTPFLNEEEQYIRFAYSGITRKEISEGLDKFINWIN
ncbi:MAG: pyridoxal phosphate-dependent aminotransferase [Candidatus Neomarinimicrobiota bacterium]